MAQIQITLDQLEVAIAEHQSLVDGLFNDGHVRLWEVANSKLQSLRSMRRELLTELSAIAAVQAT